MPMLLGSTTVACTLLSMMLGQIAVGIEALGVLLAALRVDEPATRIDHGRLIAHSVMRHFVASEDFARPGFRHLAAVGRLICVTRNAAGLLRYEVTQTEIYC